MWSIVGGACLIAIGLVRGDSVFRGDVSILTVPFDVVGVFLIVRGLVTLRRGTGSSAPPR